MRDDGPPGTMNRGAPYSRESLSSTNPEKNFLKILLWVNST